MKFLALNADFSSLGPNLLHLARPTHAYVKDGYPCKKWWFLRYLLV